MGARHLAKPPADSGHFTRRHQRHTAVQCPAAEATGCSAQAHVALAAYESWLVPAVGDGQYRIVFARFVQVACAPPVFLASSNTVVRSFSPASCVGICPMMKK